MSAFHSVSPKFLPWLTHQSVITDKLKANSSQVIMQVINHQCEPSNWWERQVLSLSNNDMVLRREILMMAGEEPCWFARTIIPKQTYIADTIFFDRLKHESLAKLIYDEARVERKLLHSYSISKDQLEYHWVENWCENESILWTRFSHFKFDAAHEFYLIEIFLPGLNRALNSSH